MELLQKSNKILKGFFKKSNKGQLLVEVLVAMAISGIILPALIIGLTSSNSGQAQTEKRAAAVALLKETEEAVRSVREKGWSNFEVPNGSTHHPVVTSNAWTFASETETVNDFTRSLTISNVYRDTNGVIVSEEEDGVLDPSTKKIELEVTWENPYESQVSSTMFVTRFQGNTANTESSEEDFEAGTIASTLVTDTGGGAITLAENRARWCSPEFSPATIDLPDGPPVAVSATSSATIAEPNKVFVATSPYSTTSAKLAYVSVSADTEVPTTSQRGTFTLDPAKYSDSGLVPTGIGLDNSFITNDVKYYKSASGKLYALLATTKPDREVVAILVDDNNPSNDNTNNGEFQDNINDIFKYHTFFDTKIYGTAGAFNTGFADPSAHSADSGGDGNGFDSNPTRAYTNNSSYAIDNNSGNGTGINCTGADKDKHRFYNYDFSVPSGASIDGIEVRLDARVDSTSGSPFMCVQLSWDGGTTWTTSQSTSTLSTSQTTYLLGGSNDTWGRSWTDSDFSNTNFRLRVIDVASNTSRDFSLDWAAVKVYYSGGTLSSNDQSPYGYGASSLEVLDDRAYTISGGYLYAFDLLNIDDKSVNEGLDMVGCRIQIDGYDCNAQTSRIRKYGAGNTDTNWDAESAGQTACLDGGNVEIFADRDIYPVKVGTNTYVYVAVGASTNPEFSIVNVTSVPDSTSSPSLTNSSCGRISGGASGWKQTSSLDFNSDSGSEEAANSVFGRLDGNRAYISSNGGVDEDDNGQPDSWQFYVLDSSNKSSPAFLSGSPSTGATSGYYYGSGANAELFPRRSLTVLNGLRAVLVGKDGFTNGNDAQEYQVLNIENEASPAYCGGINFDQGFNDLTSVSETDGDNFVYMVANTTVNELKIIQGGPDGLYVESGTYTSPPLDFGASVALNRISATSIVPSGTTLTFQIAATDPVGGSCGAATYNYVGPDGTAGTFFSSTGGAIPLAGDAGFINPAQCVSYKAYLSTDDFNVTPEILDVSINYSP